jgi:hypothetical protein
MAHASPRPGSRNPWRTGRDRADWKSSLFSFSLEISRTQEIRHVDALRIRRVLKAGAVKVAVIVCVEPRQQRLDPALRHRFVDYGDSAFNSDYGDSAFNSAYLRFIRLCMLLKCPDGKVVSFASSCAIQAAPCQ